MKCRSAKSWFFQSGRPNTGAALLRKLKNGALDVEFLAGKRNPNDVVLTADRGPQVHNRADPNERIAAALRASFAKATLQEYAGFLGRRLYALPDARPGLQAGDIGGSAEAVVKIACGWQSRAPSPLLTTNFPPPVAGDLTQPAVWFFLAVIKPQLQHRMTAVPAVFKLKDVAKAAGMDPRRLSTFLDRKLIECDRPGTGRPRHFTTDDAARIGLLNRFLALRLPPSVAARLVVVHFDTSGLLALEASGHARRIESKDQLPMNGGGVILIDMGESYRSVVERLKAAA